MVTPLDRAAGLSRVFGDFVLLPDLLALKTPEHDPRPSGMTEVEHALRALRTPSKAWIRLLADTAFNMDHVEDRDLPVDADLPTLMAHDVLRTSAWLDLFEGDELTDAGTRIAQVASVEQAERTEAVWKPAQDLLGAQIRACYRGADDRSVVALLEAAARVLEQDTNEWTQRFCPGLLLVEIEALLYLAFADPARAHALLEEMVANRSEAMRDIGPPLADYGHMVNTVLHADRVCDFYMAARPEFFNAEILSLTATQATTLLLVFSGLLESPMPASPVQYLVVPRGQD